MNDKCDVSLFTTRPTLTSYDRDHCCKMPHKLLSTDPTRETGDERQRLLENVSAGNDVDFAPEEGISLQGQGTV